jgi:hypothetical protein
MDMNETVKHYRKKVDFSLLLRLALFVIIIIILAFISLFNVIEGKLNVYVAFGGGFFAILIGLVLTRISRIFWHPKKKKVISQLDEIGTILLIVYVALEVYRKWIFEHWLSGAALNAFILIIAGGLLLGRFLGTFIQIKTVLEENTPQER